MRRILLAFGLILSTLPAFANRAVMENTATLANDVYIDTINARTYFSTTSYNGSVSNVSVFIASNVVISSPSAYDSIVIYSTGNILAKDFRGDGEYLVKVSSLQVSSINSASQVVAGTLTGATLANQTITATQIANNTLTNTQMSAATYSNVTVPAANVASGNLGSSVIASSQAIGSIGTSQLTRTGTSSGTWGSASILPSISVDFDGRITSISSTSIVASSVAVGAVGTAQLAQTGTSTGTWGSASVVPVITFGFDGRVNSISSATITTTPNISCVNPAGGTATIGYGSGVCISGSTTTLVLSGGVNHYVSLVLSGSFYAGTSNVYLTIDYTIDGVLYSVTKGFSTFPATCTQIAPTATNNWVMECPLITQALADGTHHFCIAPGTNTGTMTWGNISFCAAEVH